MIRHYSSRPLDGEVVELILASAIRAPSGGFSQGWAFLALTDAADRARFWPFVPTRVEQTPTMQDAPLVVIPLAHKNAYLDRYAQADKGWEDKAESRWPAPYWFIDTGMATYTHLGEQSTSEGRAPPGGSNGFPHEFVYAHRLASSPGARDE